MFDTILEQAASRFGISTEKTQQLLAGLTALIFSSEGGPAGFVDRLRNGGLGDMVQSWIGGGPNQPISPTQLQDALGHDEIAAIAARTGLDTTTISNALSGMLPEVFSRLTPDGQLPTTIPASLGGLLGGVGSTLGDFGRPSAAAIGGQGVAIEARTATLGNPAPPGVASRSSKWPLWILLLAILAGLAWYFLGGNERAAMADANLPAATMPAQPSREAIAPVHEMATPAVAGVPGAGIATPTTQAGAELDTLTSRQGDVNVADLVKGLNLMDIHFETGSARISADSRDVLRKAAAAITRAPAGTKIEVGGHTDNSGNAASNQALSQARAEAVAKQLSINGVDAAMLSSNGFGQDKPVADNGTAQGRASNRRIVFTVQP